MIKGWVISDGNVEVHFDRVVRKTDLAICIEIEGKKFWLPLSQIDYKEWSNFVEVPVWLATQKGLV